VDAEQVKARTKRFALDVLHAVELLPRNRAGDVLGRQLLRSATSVGANYRAACRARSSSEFIAKLGVVEEEADESLYWMELIVDAGLLPEERVRCLSTECDELLRIVVASIKTARSKNRT
jgi:four helix bundle protein